MMEISSSFPVEGPCWREKALDLVNGGLDLGGMGFPSWPKVDSAAEASFGRLGSDPRRGGTFGLARLGSFLASSTGAAS